MYHIPLTEHHIETAIEIVKMNGWTSHGYNIRHQCREHGPNSEGNCEHLELTGEAYASGDRFSIDGAILYTVMEDWSVTVDWEFEVSAVTGVFRDGKDLDLARLQGPNAVIQDRDTAVKYMELLLSVIREGSGTLTLGYINRNDMTPEEMADRGY